MGEPVRVELTVLGEALSIRTSESPEYVRSLAALVEARAKALGAETRSLTSVLILTALDITDELFRTRDERSRLDGAVGARLGALVSALERASEKA
jgi:cell division protein ZapA (FtsZ GTPase activity inhibitor)